MRKLQLHLIPFVRMNFICKKIIMMLLGFVCFISSFCLSFSHTNRRDHLQAVNARLSLPLSLYDPPASTSTTSSTSTSTSGSSMSHISKTSSVGSLEDISSPDDVQVIQPHRQLTRIETKGKRKLTRRH